MPTIDQLKEQEITSTPLFLFDCTLPNGNVKRWASHSVTFEGNNYEPRLLQHNLFEIQASADEGVDGTAKVSVTLANADSHYSQVEGTAGFKGSQVTVRFVFFDLTAGLPDSEARVVFKGFGNPAEEITEATLRVTFTNRLNLQRVVLPEVRIGRRCPWLFPSTVSQRQEAVDGGAKGPYSALFRCGYSPDVVGGVGSLDGATPFTTCDFTRASCSARGMFDEDDSNRVTRRFGGVEFVPPQINVRSFGEKGTHLSPVVENEARYNDVVPLVYGTAWYQPPVVFSRNDGNLTRMEVLLGMGEIEGVIKVIVNDVEIPEAVEGADMTATGWYKVVGHGTRNGAFNVDFTDGSGNPIGDPYGSMAFLSVVVPNRISNGQSLSKIKALVKGMRLEQFDAAGVSLGTAFTNNPAWVLLDILRRSGWETSEIDLPSFAAAGAFCGGSIDTVDLYGNPASVARFQCNLVVRNRRSAGEIARGVRVASFLQLGYGGTGLLTLRAENTLALQQPALPSGSNSAEVLNGGWPAYEFSDASGVFSGILRREDGEPTLRVYAKSGGELPNRLSVEFQDQFNEYQQDSLSLVDVDDALLLGREVTAAFPGLGIPNFDQAARAMGFQLAKTIRGNRFVEFETTVRGIGIRPGDLITITYVKEGWTRQPFRVIRLAPGRNFHTLRITAQWHVDSWYTATGFGGGGRRQELSELGIPRPLVGSAIDANGINQFGITEFVTPQSDGGFSVKLTTEYEPPARPAPGNAAIPLVSLSPQLSTTGGTLAGGQTLYYAVSALDADGVESGLSFIVRAKLPPGTNTNTVSLTGLSFSPATTAFHVYRGDNPAHLLRIAANQPVAPVFTDTGLVALTQGPPDENFDHANFYWRLELQPEVAASLHSSTTVGNATLGMAVNEFKDQVVLITRGPGARQERRIIGNTATTLTIAPPWSVEPQAASYFTVSEGTWKFAGLGSGSPIEFEVVNRPGATVQVSGRSANVHDQESAYELNPLTRWQLTGGAGGTDEDVPPEPIFGLSLSGQGTVDLLGIGFTTLLNTHTISSGTLGLFYWNELANPTAHSLASGVNDTQTTITIAPAGSAIVGTLLQIQGEILEVEEIISSTEYQVVRGAYGSTAAVHASSSLVYHLTREITIVPFARGFFGSPASGSYSHSIFLPDVRIGAAEFYVNNAIGNSPVAKASFGILLDRGLRTLSGGQVSIQVEGYLAIQNNATPAYVIEASHAPGDIFAIVREAPTGGPIVMQLRQDATVYCTLTIPDGALVSNSVDGLGLAPLSADAKLNLDILAVPGAPNTLPGRDLTVTIRL